MKNEIAFLTYSKNGDLISMVSNLLIFQFSFSLVIYVDDLL